VTTARWEEVQRLFAEALDLPESEREEFVRRSASGTAVVEEVTGLLRAHLRPGLFDPLTEVRSDDVAPTLVPGARLGPWEVQSELGRGGMGAVYLVHRADGQFEQDAALKIVPVESSGPQAQSRFLAERQILARLAHPHIARLLDGGVSQDGRPWFVMERVEGVALDEYCDTRRLRVDERLRLFVNVCEAVQYAHQNLIVHRDLKPGNILVTEEGEPRLLDFGIAKILVEDRDEGHPAATQAGMRVLTPEYASPEQFRGEPVTTASDVYQLGLLLRVLLIGGTPRGSGADGSVRGADAERLSRILLTRADRVEVAKARATTPDKLAHALRGDLQAIVGKALRPEPEARYGSAGQLSDDVERYLRGRPVRARPDNWRYVAGKFVRRNAFPVSGAVGAFLLVTGLAVGMRRQARQTAIERDRAEEVIDLLGGLFRSADPLVALGDSVTVREVLDRGAERIRGELAGQPAVRSTLMSVMGDVYGSLGLRRQAIELLEEAVAIGGPVLGMNDVGMAETERRLAMYQAEAGTFPVADSLLRVAEVRLRGLDRLDATERANALNDIGFAWQVLGEFDRAEPLLEEALAEWARAPRPDPAARPAAVYTNLGWLRSSRADLDSAEVLFRRGLELRRSSLGSDHPAVATSLEALASVLIRNGDLEAADTVISEALSIRERIVGEGHPGVLSLRAQRANVLRARGSLAEAEKLLRDVLDARIGSLGEDHFVVADTRNELGLTLEAQGRDVEAEPYLRAALEGYRAAFGDEHPNPAIIEVSLARLLYRTGDLDESAIRYAHAIPILREAYPGDRRYLGDLVSLGTLRCTDEDPLPALVDLREAVDALGRGDGQGTDGHLRSLNGLAACLERRGRVDEARAVTEEALKLSVSRGDRDPYRAFALALRERLDGRG